MDKSKYAAEQYLRSIASQHLPSNARRYTYKVLLDEVNVSSSFGFKFDHKPFVGKVVDVSDAWIVLKVGRNEFMIADRNVVSAIPNIDDSVTITPYARRKFDGERVDEPVKRADGGYTIALGEVRSFFEVDKNAFVSPYLVDMLTQIESLSTEDSRRTLAQVFIDAGARTDNIKINDCSDDEVFSNPPAVTFPVNTGKFNGEVSIVYDRGADYYKVVMLRDDGTKDQIDDVDFTQLTGVVVDLIDDGAWKIANVVIDKPAPKKRMKM